MTKRVKGKNKGCHFWYAPFMEDSEIKNTVNHEGSIVMSKTGKSNRKKRYG